MTRGFAIGVIRFMSENKKNVLFSGVATALVTPFRNGEPDIPALRRLLSYQSEGEISAVVVLGTTGEASTLTETERDAVTVEAVSALKGKCPVIVGVGSNDTRRAVAFAKRAEELGADGLLAVTPYYNKGTEEGIVQHYFHIADETSLPLLLYNVPSRTGVDLTLSQYERLAAHPHIVGTKEAKGEIGRLTDLIARFPDGEMIVYTGNDSEFLPALSVGAAGVISVLSNLFPADMMNAYRLFASGKNAAAALILRNLHKTARLLFSETNPAPVKAALSILGLIENELRLPMSPVSDALYERISEELSTLGAR